MVGGSGHREPGEHRAHAGPRDGVRTADGGGVLLPSAVAIAVGTVLVAVVALFNVDEVSASALTQDGFELAAAALFLAAAVLRLARWRVTTDAHSGLLAAAMLVLVLLSLPLGNLMGQLVPEPQDRPMLALTARALGTALCLALALRAMTVCDEDRSTSLPRTLLAASVAAVAGVGVFAALFAVVPAHLTGTVLLHVAVQVVLACTWLGLGLAASRRDALQPWAGRVAPLYASLGLVELLTGLDQVQPGSWTLPSAALLCSVAMVTAHSAYVDLLESSRLAAVVARRTSELRTDLTTALSGSTADDPVSDFDVTDVVTAAARPRLAAGQEIRIRGGAGIAHGRPGDLAAAVEKLLVNAHTHAPRSPVTLHVVAIGSRVEVSVSDRGPGMSAAVAERAFGSGLGLHVARALMARNGGDLELRSRIGGATFVLVLPAAADQRTLATVPAWDVAPGTA